MIGLLSVLLLAALLCVRLGAWQLDRAEERRQQAAAREMAAAAAVEPVPIDDLAVPQTALTGAMVGVPIRVRGEYLRDARQYLVAEPDAAGGPGAILVAPLVVTEGRGAGAVLPVARGWLPGEPAQWVGLLDDVLAPPATRVELVGVLAAGEAAGEGSGEDHVLASVSPGQLVNLWRPPIYGGYLRVLSPDNAAPSVLAVPLTASAEGGAGLPLQNLAYAAQWWIFGGFAIAVWVRLVRDEAGRWARMVPQPARRGAS